MLKVLAAMQEINQPTKKEQKPKNKMQKREEEKKFICRVS